MNSFKKRAMDFFEVALKIVELGIALLLLIFIAINLVSLFGHVRFDASLTDSFKNLQHYLELSLNLIICTEFIRMIYAHTMEAVLEALIFAIARGMIAGHMDGVQTLLYVAAIFVLMVIRKYLLTRKDDSQSLKKHLEAVCHNIGGKIKDPDSK
jgi:hypothetical protein